MKLEKRCIALILLALALVHPKPARAQDVELFSPERHQLDLSVGNGFEFVDPSSVVRRTNLRDPGSKPGSALHLGPDLGLSTLQLPEVDTTFWFNHLNAFQFQARYFATYGATGLNQPVIFNGDVIAPGQLLSTGGTRWFAFDFFYERRLTPLYQAYEENLPAWLRGWDLRGLIGLEFVYLDFRIRDGHPNIISGRYLTRGRFHERELPVPTIGIEARRELYGPLQIEITAHGNWINKVDSLRNEGGTVYLSQAGFETHWRIVYASSALHGVKPFVGADYIYYKQVPSSGLVKDFIRAEMYGPEFGLKYSF